jgi:hypothetical protein
MIQLSLAFFQLLGIIWMALLPSSTLVVDQRLKASSNLSNTLLVELQVKRGTVSGTVKFEQNLPIGFNASPSDVKGGIFVLKDSTLSITWTDFPREDDFLITYKLIYPEGSSGNVNLSGLFSYLENNDKRTYDLPSSSVLYGSSTSSREKKVSSSDTPTVVEKDFGKPESPSSGINCTREVVNLTEKSVLIKVVVNNPDGITGFARMEDVIPTGFAVKVYDSQGASFSFVNSRARIIWTEMPNTKTFFCSYKLIKIESEAVFIDIEGIFSYLKEGQTINLPVSTGGISFRLGNPEDIEKYKKPPVPVEAPALSNKPADLSPSEPQKITETKSTGNSPSASIQKTSIPLKDAQKNHSPSVKSKTEGKQTALLSKTQPTVDFKGKDGKPKTKNTESSRASTPVAQSADSTGAGSIAQNNTKLSGIIYRVQVCAVRKNAPTEQIARELTLSETITPEMHDGWFKYTIGEFSEYAEAKTLRNQKSSLPTGPFVSAYNQGNRITVQEALMVTRQTWIK